MYRASEKKNKRFKNTRKGQIHLLKVSEGKSLKELIAEVYELVGAFAFNRDDLHLKEAQKQSIIAQCKAGAFHAFGDFVIKNTETIDGFKYYLSDDEWVMIRPSGTEPVLRVYAEAPEMSRVREILDATKATLLSGVEA